jgi:hypothetical protein
MTNNSRNDIIPANAADNINCNAMVRILRSVERDINNRADCCKTTSECVWFNASIGAIIRAERYAQ